MFVRFYVDIEMIFTTRRYASAVYNVVVCLSVCLSVRLSHAGTIPKWLIQDHANNAIRQSRDSSFLTPNILAKFRRRKIGI